MNQFTVYPAIDLRNGKVVRLRQGDAARQKIYGDDPGAVTQEWIDQGAEWLHVVNLNGAFGEDTEQNEIAIMKILAVGRNVAKIQLGGGIRSLPQIESALSLGISRVVLGTSVIENPGFGIKVLAQFGGEKIAFGLDALGQELMSRGWQSPTGISMKSLAGTLVEAGAQTLIYTNIQKDGMATGVDWENAKLLAKQTSASVFASGGVSSLSDIMSVISAGLDGVIVGRALYERKFTLQEALNVS